MVGSTPAVAVAVESEQSLLVAPVFEVPAQRLVLVPATGCMSAVGVQHLKADEEAVYRAVGFEGQHLMAVMEASA